MAAPQSEHHSRVLLEWLNAAADPEERRKTFFCDEEGTVKEGEGAWGWWFEKGGEKTGRELERREKVGVKRRRTA